MTWTRKKGTDEKSTGGTADLHLNSLHRANGYCSWAALQYKTTNSPAAHAAAV